MQGCCAHLRACQVQLSAALGKCSLEVVPVSSSKAANRLGKKQKVKGRRGGVCNKLAEPLPILGNNTTSQPVRRLFLYAPLHFTDYITATSPLPIPV